PYTTLFRSAGEGARIEEAPAASLDDPERDQRHAGDEQDEAGQIGQLTRRFVARLAGQFVAADHGGDADRDVDVEDPPPAPGLDDERPERRADRRRQRTDRSPEGHRARTARRREGVEHERERRRQEERGAEGL